jgi:hypothetical protein
MRVRPETRDRAFVTPEVAHASGLLLNGPHVPDTPTFREARDRMLELGNGRRSTRRVLLAAPR